MPLWLPLRVRHEHGGIKIHQDGNLHGSREASSPVREQDDQVMLREKVVAKPSDKSSVRKWGSSQSSASDGTLLARLRAGNNDAATALYLRYARRLHAITAKACPPGLAVRVSPEDIVQSVFRTFFRRAKQGSYDAPVGEELWKLILVIALNKVRAIGAFHRAEKRDISATAGSPALEHVADHEGGADAMTLLSLKTVLEEILSRLPEQQRQIVEMRIEGHEVQEISDKTGRAKRSVERILQNFRKSLAAKIDAGE